MSSIIQTTEQIKAILNGTRTVMRTAIKPQPTAPRWNNIGFLGWDDGHGYKMKLPHHKGDLLYVRETWDEWDGGYCYKADWQGPTGTWHSSAAMPREAARIFLHVMRDSWPQKLQDITEEQARAEGVDYCCPSQRHAGWSDRWISGYCHDCAHHDPMTGKRPTCTWGGDEESRFQWSCGCTSRGFKLRDDSIPEPYRFKFAFAWDERTKVPFWRQNPWVWVTEFERVEKPIR